ncbi:MAG TPA: CheR family methyltransferase, partial [Candidatus Eisenbacteria bacterium]|nr:CheR family methyltransferase [Candidatus Eisenbacteria bacterium]
RGFDFTAYKRSSLVRRIEKRQQAVGALSFETYQEYLESHVEEFPLLFNTILINVTSFFRDADAWRYVASETVPRILAATRPEGAIRVWSAGCASGEEAYTIAMVLAEQLGVEQFRHRVKIYASDVDEDALVQARHATYGVHQVEDVPPEYLARYFERVDDRYVFHKDLRRSIIFGRHDLVQDAPISRVHLLTCRNTLMYFTRETQGRVLSRFHFAVRGGGYLFMGRAELLLTHGDLFTPVELKWRVFTKTPGTNGRDHFMLPTREEGNDAMPGDETINALALEADPVARLVIRTDGALALANARARGLFRLSPLDIGKRFQDLELSYRPVELRSVIQEATTQRGNVSRKDVLWPTDTGEPRYLDVEVVPLRDSRGETPGVQVSFLDTTRVRRLQEDLERSKNELETAYEELQSSNEELETTNEELQSTNEELETTNEELQSTNEELETMNEELQSTNEELETTNTELRMRSEELNHANAFLASVLSGLEAGVVVVDPDFQVLAWNHRAEDMWGLRADEVQNRHLLNLDIGLPVEQLRGPVRAVLAQESAYVSIAVEAVNRRGKHVRCSLRVTPLRGSAAEIRGAIVLMEEEPSS